MIAVSVSNNNDLIQNNKMEVSALELKKPYMIALSSAVSTPELMKELQNYGFDKFIETPLKSE